MITLWGDKFPSYWSQSMAPLYTINKGLDTMAIIKATAIKSTNGSDVTAAGSIYVGKNNKNDKWSLVTTVTGIEGPIMQMGKDKSALYYGIALTLTLSEALATRIATDMDGYFNRMVQLKMTDPKVAIVFECDRLGIPVAGVNPRDGQPSMNLIIDEHDIVSYRGVERGDDTFDATSLLESAQELGAARSMAAYLGAADRKVSAQGNAQASSVMQGLIGGIFAGFQKTKVS